MNRNAEHTELVNRCLLVLSDLHVLCTRTERGAGWLPSGRYKQFGTTGWADISGTLPNSRSIYVECKTGKARLNRDQRAFRDAALKVGALHIVARDPDELRQAIARALETAPRQSRSCRARSATRPGDARRRALPTGQPRS
jgi:hypothetical protein